jgi:DivIVA domain-containing protein
MDVTPQELRGSEIKEAWRGYHRDEVDELLERAAVTIENLSQQLSTAGARPAAPSADPGPLQLSRDDADTLQRTLLLAQRAADDAVNDAQAQARKLIEESEARAQSLVGEAEATARRIAESERRRLEAEIQDLAARRDVLQADADALEDYASAYRDRVRAAIEADLARLGSGTIDPPRARPELSEVDVPEPPTQHAPAPETDVDPDRGGAGRGEFPADTRAITIDAPSAAASFATEPASSPVAAPPRPAESDWPPAAPFGTEPAAPFGTEPAAPFGTEPASPFGTEPAAQYARQSAPEAAAPGAPSFGTEPAAPFGTPSAPEAAAPGAPSGSWLRTNDDWSPADPAFEEPAPWEQATAVHEPFSSDVPMEAHTVDADGLDDDAFFASLREAVRDEEPLGPRDTDSSAFFDDDGADDRRRFRRRR